jgi:hypothetical protein
MADTFTLVADITEDDLKSSREHKQPRTQNCAGALALARAYREMFPERVDDSVWLHSVRAYIDEPGTGYYWQRRANGVLSSGFKEWIAMHDMEILNEPGYSLAKPARFEVTFTYVHPVS